MNFLLNILEIFGKGLASPFLKYTFFLNFTSTYYKFPLPINFQKPSRKISPMAKKYLPREFKLLWCVKKQKWEEIN